ncbi:MAG: fluoride efflux transporter FluC [Acidimicrobiales bacterium]
MAPTLTSQPRAGIRVEPTKMTVHKEATGPEPPARLPVLSDLATEELVPAGRAPRRHRKGQRTILLVVGSAGALGALARYGVESLLPSPAGQFPWSIFWINVSGSLAIGFVLVLLTERFPRGRLARPLIATGLLGAFTTFSTYTVDADLLFRARHFVTGGVYSLSSLFAGVVAALVGIVLACFLIRLDHRLNEQLS